MGHQFEFSTHKLQSLTFILSEFVGDFECTCWFAAVELMVAKKGVAAL